MKTVLRPYKYGTRVVWLDDIRAAREKEFVEGVNKEIKKASTKTAKKQRAKERKEVNKLIKEQKNKETKVEIKKVQTQKEINTVLSKRVHTNVARALNDNYYEIRRNYLARMDKIVEGMQGQIKGKEPITGAALSRFWDEFKDLSESDMALFYEDNRDLFIDMSDYYDYLLTSSGLQPGSPNPKNYTKMEDYFKDKAKNIDEITQRIRKFKQSKITSW